VNDPSELSAPLAAALTALTLALDEPGENLADSVARFALASRLAISSYLGMSVHATVNGRELGFTTLDERDTSLEITTSLRLAMDPSLYPATYVDAFPTIVLILYARTPGAFVDLSADLVWLRTTGVTRATYIALDQDLAAPVFRRIDIALGVMSSIDQATGVLIERGSTPDQARGQLAVLSAASGRTLHAEAEHLLASLGPGRSSERPGAGP
jgi:hypothetical protein